MRQYSINHTIGAWEAFKSIYGEERYKEFLNVDHVEQIRSCQAWIIYDKLGNKWLQSYNTIVSVKFAGFDNVVRLGRWSVTTSRHQSYFERVA
jgi:hypothetical protein